MTASPADPVAVKDASDPRSEWEVARLGPGSSAEACVLLSELASNRIAAIKIGQFLSESELAIAQTNLQQQTISWYANKEHHQGRIGINATGYSHLPNGRQQYFDAAPVAEKSRGEIFKGTEDPIDRLLTFFASGYTTKIATEPDLNNARYFAGLIRAMGAKSTLHFDYAPSQLPGWGVSGAEEQLGLVLYLQMPDEGGELNIYNRPWVSKDDVHNNDKIGKGTHGFTEGFLGDTPFAQVNPSEGDLVVFKTRNFHQVGEIKSHKPRLGMTTFMSMQGGVLSLWS